MNLPVLTIEVEAKGMFGSPCDLYNVRARPELDDYMFDPGVAVEQGIWDPDSIDVGDHRSRIGPVKDRYCVLGMRDWFEIILRNILLEETERYAITFPKLRMVYLGGLHIRVKVVGSGDRGNAVPLYKNRRDFSFIPGALFDTEGGEGIVTRTFENA